MKAATDKPYALLLEWLDRTGHSRKELLGMLASEAGVTVSEQHLSGVLRGRWGFSLATLLAISEVTGLPVEKLVTRPGLKRNKHSRRAA